MRFRKIRNLISINVSIFFFVYAFHERILTRLDTYNTAVVCNVKSNPFSKYRTKKDKLLINLFEFS